MKRTLLSFVLLLTVSCAAADKKDKKSRSLDDYLGRVRSSPTAVHVDRTLGSLWLDSGSLAEPVSDLHARSVGDPITIEIMELTSAELDSSVDTQRSFSASSGISALPGKINTAGIENLFSPSSSQVLQGQGKAASSSRLRTTLAGRVVAVLGSGALVVEAQRDVLMNDQRNHIVLRGVARTSDISPNNVILSTRLSDLEVELAGKGVISDGTRRPGFLMRLLLRLLNF